MKTNVAIYFLVLILCVSCSKGEKLYPPLDDFDFKDKLSEITDSVKIVHAVNWNKNHKTKQHQFADVFANDFHLVVDPEQHGFEKIKIESYGITGQMDLSKRELKSVSYYFKETSFDTIKDTIEQHYGNLTKTRGYKAGYTLWKRTNDNLSIILVKSTQEGIYLHLSKK